MQNAKNDMEITKQQNQLLLKEDEKNRLMIYKQESERKDLLLNSLKEQVERLEVVFTFNILQQMVCYYLNL